MNKPSAIQVAFTFVLFTLIQPVTARGTAPARLEGRLILKGGQQFAAQISSSQNGKWQVTSPLFYDPAVIQESAIFGFQFRNRNCEINADAFLFQLLSGETLVGNLVSIDNKICRIKHFDLGVIEVDSQQLKSVTRISQNQKAFTAADMMGTQSIGSSTDNGTIQLAKDQTWKTPFSLEPKTAVSLLFHTRAETEFRILLKAGPKIVSSIQVSIDGIMAESADSIEFADLEIRPGVVQLTFVIADERLSIRDQRGTEVLRQELKTTKATTFEIINDSDRLEVIQARAEASHEAIKIGEQNLGSVIVIDRDGKSFSCESLEIKDGLAIFAETRLPLGELQSIQFGGRSFVESPAPAAFLIWADGSRLRISQFETRDAKLLVSSKQILGEPMMEVSSPRALFLGRSKLDRPQVGYNELVIGDAMYSGKFNWGDPQRPLTWKFEGFDAPVVLKMNRKIVLSRFVPDRQAISKSPDRLVLSNGSILPCKIFAIGKDGVQIDSPLCDTKTIPADQFRACFFENHFSNGEVKSITNESIQRMLRIPRFARDIEPEHCLIAANGDLLRGTLVAIGRKKITLDSRGELLRIDRERISGIIRLNDERRNNPASPDTVAIDYGNDVVVVGKIQSTDTRVAIEVPGCGVCNIPKIGMKTIQVNADRSQLSDLYQYASWYPMESIAPRWSEPTPQENDAGKLVGKLAPDFELTTLDGQPFRLSDHLGKVVVLDFWATWSRPSVLGIPRYLKVMEAFSEGEVIFVTVNFAETSSAVKSFQEKVQWDARILMDPSGGIARQYNVTAIPNLVVINPQGTIAEVKIGFNPNASSDLKQQVEKLLSPTTPQKSLPTQTPPQL